MDELYHRPTRRSGIRALTFDTLEDRLVPAVNIQFDYRYDTTGFFNNATIRAELEQAGRDIGARLDNNLGAIAPSGGNSWSAMFFAPNSGNQTELSNLYVPEKTLVIFVGARNLAGSEAGIGGTGGYRAAGQSSWFSQLSTRGQSGYSLWGGSISFDSDANWSFSDVVPSGKIDFYTVASHELGHVLGFGTATTFSSFTSGRSFTGTAARIANGGVAPNLSADLAHWAQGTTSGGQPASMMPYVLTGQRYGLSSLDYAALTDIGWSVSAPAPVVPVGPPVSNVTHDPIILSGPANGIAQVVRYIDGEIVPDANAVRPIAGYTGTLRGITADVNGDNVLDVVYATGPGGSSRFTIIDGKTGTALINPEVVFGSEFSGGLFLAAADVNNDGKDEIIVSPDQGGGGRVSVFTFANGKVTRTGDFFGIDDVNFRGGARVAAADLNGDGTADLVVGAGFGGGPRVAMFDGKTLSNAKPQKFVGDFFAFPGDAATKLRNGVYITAGDVNGDKKADLIFGAGPGGGPQVYVLDTASILTGNLAAAQRSPLKSFFAFDVESRGGVRVAVKDVNGDGKMDLLTGSGSGAVMNWYSNFDPAKSERYEATTLTNTNDGLYVGAAMCECAMCREFYTPSE